MTAQSSWQDFWDRLLGKKSLEQYMPVELPTPDFKYLGPIAVGCDKHDYKVVKNQSKITINIAMKCTKCRWMIFVKRQSLIAHMIPSRQYTRDTRGVEWQ